MSIGVTDIIAPLGSFPALEDVNLKGGYQTSASTVDRDAIPTSNRKPGMMVYTLATSETWILGPGITNGDWSLTAITPIGGVPVDVTKAAAAQGVSGAASRSDHKHDISTAAASSLTHQATSSEGSASSVARSDHVHGFTAPAAPADVIVQTASAGSSANFAREDHLHNAVTAAPTQGIGGANSAGSSSSLSRADHNHALRTTTGPTDLTVGAIADGEVLKRVGTAVVGFVIPGTVITVQEEGVTQSTTVNTFNFVGSAITASGGGATATITVSLSPALGGAGGIVARRTVTGPTTVSIAVTDHLILVDTTSGAVTLTLPDPSLTDRIYEIKDIAGTFGTNACTLARNTPASDQIEGLVANYLLEANYQIQRIGSNGGTNWWLL
jgi:hypothetical protein